MSKLTVFNDGFAELVTQINEHLEKVGKHVIDGEFESGEITVKIKVGTENKFEEYPAESGGQDKIVEYIEPDIQFDVKTDLKKAYKTSGYADFYNMAIMVDDYGEVVLEEVEKAQTDLF